MNTVFSINGPVVKVKDTTDFSMLEMVYVGAKKLVGEVINMSSEETTIQVYESTTGLKPGEPVTGSGMPMSAVLGPGIISNIFDGIERPLKKLEEISGAFIGEGSTVSSLDTEKKIQRHNEGKGRGQHKGRRYLRRLPRNTRYRA